MSPSASNVSLRSAIWIQVLLCTTFVLLPARICHSFSIPLSDTLPLKSSNNVKFQPFHSRIQSSRLSPQQQGQIISRISQDTCLSMSSSSAPSMISTLSHTISAFSQATTQSSTTAISQITDVALSTPPLGYFTCLVAAGFGVPVSEDALCIFAGTVLPTLWMKGSSTAASVGGTLVDTQVKWKLLLALYAGVVVSDCITFGIGRMMRMGVLEPIRKRMKLSTEQIEFCEEDTFQEEEWDEEAFMEEEAMEGEEPEGFCVVETPDLKKQNTILEKIQRAGNYTGFLVRFSIGMRTPMMLLAGFSGSIPFARYALGTAVGAICSLSCQLGLGYTMRGNPAALVGIVASVSTFVLMVPVVIAVASSMSMIARRWSIRAR